MATHTNDLREIRKKKRRRRFFKKMLIILCLLFFVFVVYLTKEKWLPLFSGFVDKCKTTIVNEGNLAEGKFPIMFEKSSNSSISSIDDNFILLTDTYILSYEKDGKMVYSKQHGMSDPILETKNGKALLYNQGGKKFSLLNKSKTLYSKELDEQIIFAEISNSGYVAVVTKSDKYASMMTIYDDDGDIIFYSSSNDKIADVAFNNSNGCIVTTMCASDGQLVSNISYYEFNKETEIWRGSPLNLLIFDTQIYSNKNISSVGISEYNNVSQNGEILNKYDYKDDLIGYSISSEFTALVFNNLERRKTYSVILGSDNSILEIPIINNFKSIKIANGKVYVMTDRDIVAYSLDGNTLATVSLVKEYKDFAVVDNYIYLLGGSIVDKIDFKS